MSVFAKRVTAILGLIALESCLVFAQSSTAAISGLVRDTSGAFMPGMSITVKHIESGLTRTSMTSESGGYNMQLLPVGAYELVTDMPGFKQQMRRGINLAVGQEAVVNLTLEIGAHTELITVTDEAPIVNTTLSATSGLINEAQIKDLPLNGRSFDQLLTLNVGTVDNRSNIGNNGWTAFSVAGKRPETNRFLMNGVDYIGSNGSGTFITPSGSSGQLLGVEAVREYNVLQHTYGAEYGKRAGAQVTVVSSSGTNQWHGDLFEYIRNDALDARNFFEEDKGPFKRNQFGGALGGPLKKEKTFLFGNYEGFRERWGVPSAAIVPDAQARQGFLPNAAGVYVPVPNLEPRMLPYADYFWPVPNGPEILANGLPTGSAYASSNPKRKVREDFGLLRLDYAHSSKDSFYVNFNGDDGFREAPQVDPVFLELTRQRSFVFGLRETHIFSPNVVNAATLGFSRARGTQVVAPATPTPSNLIFLTGTNPGSITIGGSAITVVAAAFAPANGNSLNWDVRNYATWADDVRITKGKHSWSAGVWIQRVQQNIYGINQATAGSVSYPTLLAFLQDQPTQFIANTNPQPLYFRSTEGAWYVQDEIKVKPHLTLRLGLRDEMTNGWNEAHKRASNYIYVNDVIQTDPRIGSSAFLENNAKALWQPRVGLAWDPTGTGKWAVRAGFGIHHDLQDNLGHRLNANAPFNARLTVTGTPLHSIIPIPFGKQLPPSCNSQSSLRPPDCTIFVAGGIDPVLKTPTLQQWALTVERGITNDLMLQFSYVGSEGYHVLTGMNRNMARPQVCSDPAGCLSGGIRPANQAVRVPEGTTYMPSTPPVGAGRAQLQMRPNPFVGSTLSWFYNGTISYHSGNVSLAKRSSRGLTFKANYTFSKILDINSAILAAAATNEPATVLNPFDLKLSKGLASFNLKHQFNANFIYPLPIGRGQRFGGGAPGLTDKLFGSWQWSGALTIQSGFPFTPQVGSNSSGSGDTLIPDVPNRNPYFNGPVILGKVGQWFDPRAFLMPPAGTFGNVARGSFIGPGLWNLDTSLAKKFSVTEQVSMQFRAEAFNVFNHPNFASPNPVVFTGNNYSSSAGAITATSTASRQIQFALKLLF
jgi:Carboxypeptidase regulatory-like domain